MASMFNLRYIFQLIIHRFDDGAFSQEEFIHQRHELVFHVFLNLGDQLKTGVTSRARGNVPGWKGVVGALPGWPGHG